MFSKFVEHLNGNLQKETFLNSSYFRLWQKLLTIVFSHSFHCSFPVAALRWTIESRVSHLPRPTVECTGPCAGRPWHRNPITGCDISIETAQRRGELYTRDHQWYKVQYKQHRPNSKQNLLFKNSTILLPLAMTLTYIIIAINANKTFSVTQPSFLLPLSSHSCKYNVFIFLCSRLLFRRCVLSWRTLDVFTGKFFKTFITHWGHFKDVSCLLSYCFNCERCFVICCAINFVLQKYWL